MKKLLLLITLLFITTFSFTAIHAQDPITVLYNGSKIDFDVAPVMQNDRIMVPVRAIFEKMNAFVLWDEANSRVIAVKNGEYCTLEIGSNILKTGICEGGTPDGKLIETASVEIDVPAAIKNDRTLIPLRAVSQAMRASVDWNGDTNTCTITTTEDQAADGWFYYASWSDTGKLYKIDSNGNHRQKLVDLDCYNIFYRDGWVYFYTWSNRERLYRVDVNGENLQQLTKERVRIIHEENNWVYYTALLGLKKEDPDYENEGPLYRMHWDGSEKQLITNDVVRSACFDGDTIYYTGEIVDNNIPYYHYNIYKVSIDGKDKQQIPMNGYSPVYGIIRLHNGHLYFKVGDSRENYLYRISLKDYSARRITKEVVDYAYYFMDNCILYESTNGLRTVDYDGLNDMIIVNNNNHCLVDYRISTNKTIYYYFNEYVIKHNGNTMTGEDKYELWCCDLNGQNQTKVFESTKYPCVRGNRIFYSDSYSGGNYEMGHGLTCLDLDGKNPFRITDGDVDLWNLDIFKNRIYVNTSDKKLYRYNLDGSGKKKITNEETMFFTFVPTGV